MIPIIDLSDIIANKEEAYPIIAKQIFDAYSKYGFGAIINHGIPKELIDKLFQQHHAFHALDIDTKLKYRYGKYLRGYLPLDISTIKTSTLAKVTKPNQSESFMIVNEPFDEEVERLKSTPFGGKQVWPGECQEFKTTALSYITQMAKLSEKLVQLFALALGIGQNDLGHYFTHAQTLLRFLHYPPHPKDLSKDIYGSAPHTDYGWLTLLVQDNIGGLQVKSPEGDWIDVPPDPNAIILNTGDMIERLSNGLLKSTPHRVINRSPTQSRYSIPFFYHSNYDTIVEPLPSCVSEKHPAQFEPVHFGKRLADILYKNYRL